MRGVLINVRPIKSYNLYGCVEFGFYSNHAIYVIKDTDEADILISKIFSMNYSKFEIWQNFSRWVMLKRKLRIDRMYCPSALLFISTFIFTGVTQIVRDYKKITETMTIWKLTLRNIFKATPSSAWIRIDRSHNMNN